MVVGVLMLCLVSFSNSLMVLILVFMELFVMMMSCFEGEYVI